MGLPDNADGCQAAELPLSKSRRMSMRLFLCIHFIYLAKAIFYINIKIKTQYMTSSRHLMYANLVGIRLTI